MSGMPFGFGLMQGGGAYGGPMALQRARDPRYAYANALIERGTSGAPAQTNLEGLSRAGQALVGAWLARDANNDWSNRENNRALAIANALKDASGTPAETKAYGDGTTINWDAVKPNMGKAIAGLAANPDTADMAAQWQARELQFQREREARAEDRNANQAFTLKRDAVQNDFATARDNLNRAHAEYMQDRSAANQFKLQAAQQQFQAAESALNRTFQQGQQERAQQFTLSSAGPIAGAQAKAGIDAQLAPAPEQFQTEGAPPKSVAEVVSGIKNAGANRQTQVTNEGKLRDDFSGQQAVKNYKEVVPIIQSIGRASDTPAGDLNIIYGLGKIMDPNSVVREGELSLAIKAGSPAERLQGIWNYVAGGGRLSQEQRANLLQEAQTRFAAHQDAYNQTSAQFTDIAKRSGLDPRNIIIGLEGPQSTPRVSSAEDFAACECASGCAVGKCCRQLVG